MRTRTAGLAAAVVLAAGAAAGGALALSGGDEPAAEIAGALDGYTDDGDGCAQIVSAIAYADDLLRPLGQEPYQDFDNAVRSRLSSVAGTVRTERSDWPDATVERQATRLGLAARDAARLAPTPAEQRARTRALVVFKREAAQMVLDCAPLL